MEDMHKAMAELAALEREHRQAAQAAVVRADNSEELSRQLEREVTDLGNQVAVLQNKLGAGGHACWSCCQVTDDTACCTSTWPEQEV